MKQIKGINDFVVKFANVNGTGSASANHLFAKAIFRMGIPVSPRNIFPSNIQGLPTWYEVRASEAGWVARREGVDLMVAMNAQTYEEDLAAVVPGGWLLYDSSMPRVWPRQDITVLGIPIAEICARRWREPRGVWHWYGACTASSRTTRRISTTWSTAPAASPWTRNLPDRATASSSRPACR